MNWNFQIGFAMKKVLFLDDEEDIIELYRMSLDDEKEYQFIFYSDAKKAYEFLCQNYVDLVVCDENLKGIRGLDILKGMRESGLNKASIFYLASGNPDLNTKAYDEFNCARFFQKPFELDDILAMIKKDLK